VVHSPDATNFTYHNMYHNTLVTHISVISTSWHQKHDRLACTLYPASYYYTE